MQTTRRNGSVCQERRLVRAVGRRPITGLGCIASLAVIVGAGCSEGGLPYPVGSLDFWGGLADRPLWDASGPGDLSSLDLAILPDLLPEPTCGSATALQAGAPWPTQGRCPNHQSRSRYVGAQTGQIRWTAQLSPHHEFHPALAIAANGTVFAGTDQGLYALDGATGAQRWSAPDLGSINSTPTIGRDGTVYVGSLDPNSIYAVDGDSGQVRWSFAAGDKVVSSPTLTEDGGIIFGTVAGLIDAVDARTGRLRWAIQTGGRVSASAALSGDGTAYLGSRDGHVYAIEVATGRTKWSYVTGERVDTDVVVGDDGTVFVAAYSRLHAIDGQSGLARWTIPLLAVPVGGNPALGANGTLYLPSYGQHALYAIEVTTGAVRWTFNPSARPENTVGGSPTIGADGTVYVSSGDMRLDALDGDTGRVKWSLEDPTHKGLGAQLPIGRDGTVYAAGGQGSLYAIGP